jgi:hypothetical protein
LDEFVVAVGTIRGRAIGVTVGMAVGVVSVARGTHDCS